MMHVSILIPRGHTSVVNIGGTHQILNLVNGMLAQRGAPPAFDVHLVGLERETRQSTGLFSVSPDMLLREVKRTDIIILPAIHDNPDTALENNREFLPWLQEQRAGGAEIACFCVGSFFLAETGLLDGRTCATHWMHADAFRTRFPQVNLVDEMILTDEDGIYTSGGAYAFLNLLLHLIEKYTSREMAVLASKAFSIDIGRDNQSAFIMFQGQRNHDDPLVHAAQDLIEDNPKGVPPVSQLARRLAASRRTLERRFKAATTNSIAEYVQRVRIEAAKKRLESSHMTVGDVMLDVGYSDPKAFRNLFRRLTGLTPIDYRSRFNAETRSA